MQSNCRIMVPRFYTFEGLGQNTQFQLLIVLSIPTAEHQIALMSLIEQGATIPTIN